MPPWLIRTIGLVVTLALLALAAAGVAPALIDRQQLLSDLESELSLALGYPTRIESIGMLRLLPTPRLRLDGVQVAETLAADAPQLTAVEAVQLEAAIAPLLTGRLVLSEVAIERPQIRLPAASSPQSAGPNRASARPGANPRGFAPGDTDPSDSDSGALREQSPLPSAPAPEAALAFEPVPVPAGQSAASAQRTAEAVAEAAAEAAEAEARAEATAEAAAEVAAEASEAGHAQPSAPLPVDPSAHVAELPPAAPPTLPPIQRLIIRDGELSGPVAATGAGAGLSLRALSLTAGPIAAGESGHLDATFEVADERSGWSLPGLAKAEITLADPLTEVALRPLHLRFAGGTDEEDLVVDVDSEIRIDLLTSRVSIDSLNLVADALRINGLAQLYPTPTGVGVDGQFQVPPFDLRAWLAEHMGLKVPGGLERVGGELGLQLRGSVLTIEQAALMLDRARASVVARLRLGQSSERPVSGQVALAVDQLDLDTYLLGAPGAPSPAFEPAPAPASPPLPQPGEGEPGLGLQATVAELRLGGLRLSAVQVVGHALARALELDASASFYGGWLTAGVDLVEPSDGPAAAQGPVSPPALGLDAAADAVDLAALLTDLQLGAHKQVPITGLAEIELDLLAHGADAASILQTLGGKADFSVRDGAITLVDLEQLISGTLGAVGISPADSENLTRFSLLSLSAEGTEGRFRSKDIQLRSNLLEVDGTGQVDLPTQQIALDLQAVLTKPPQGRGIKELEGIPVPISASGPLLDPRWEVDVRAALDHAARRALSDDSGLLDELEERTGIKGLGDGLRQILPGLLGQ